MRRTMVFLSATMLLASFAQAREVQIKKEVVVAAPPAAVWNVANEFCSIKTWGGVFSDCTQHMKKGVVWRLLTIKDGGGTVTEKLTDVTDTSYDYAITNAPLPIRNHTGKIWVEQGMNGNTVVKWHVAFDLKPGADKAKTAEAIDGILTTGLGGIKEIAERKK